MKTLVLSILIWASLPMVATAQDSDRANAMRAAYEDWLERNQITGTGALAFEGTPVSAIEDGTVPVELASVSKSITALCAAALWDAGDLDLSDTVRDVLGRGPDVSITSLITHSSGITEDVTQTLMSQWLDTDGPRGMDVLDAMAAPSGKPGQFAYSNVNYALLGLVIEASAEGRYEDICHRLVMEPAGATGEPSPRSGGFLSWGGWAMAPRDYARLHAHWFGSATQTGRDPLAYPHVAVGDGGVYYGLGTFFRVNHTGDGSYNFWHFGALCIPGALNVGSYAVTWGAAWTAVLGYDGCVDFDSMFDLDAVMSRAAYGPLP